MEECYQFSVDQSSQGVRNATNFYILVEVTEAHTVGVRHISHAVGLGLVCGVRFRPVGNGAVEFLSFVRSGKNGRCACQKIYQADCRNYDDTWVDFSFLIAVRSVAVCLVSHPFFELINSCYIGKGTVNNYISYPFLSVYSKECCTFVT